MYHYQHFFKNYKEGRDYEVYCRRVQGAAFAVISPHGGGIEPGTTEVSRAVAGADNNFYSFVAKKYSGNEALHLKSTRFDEPRALKILEISEACLAIHGCDDKKKFVYIGGLNEDLTLEITEKLECAGFKVKDAPPGLAAVYSSNICNRCGSGRGVQLELSYGLRKGMFKNVDRRYGRKKVTDCFYQFVDAVRKAIGQYKRHNSESGSSSRVNCNHNYSCYH